MKSASIGRLFFVVCFALFHASLSALIHTHIRRDNGQARWLEACRLSSFCPIPIQIAALCLFVHCRVFCPSRSFSVQPIRNRKVANTRSILVPHSVPGSHANVQKLKKMFDTGKDHNLMTMEALDPNDIATLLKLYLRERRCTGNASMEMKIVGNWTSFVAHNDTFFFLPSCRSCGF